jgi:hypothetical protein
MLNYGRNRSLEHGNDVYICFVDFEKALHRDQNGESVEAVINGLEG